MLFCLGSNLCLQGFDRWAAFLISPVSNFCTSEAIRACWTSPMAVRKANPIATVHGKHWLFKQGAGSCCVPAASSELRDPDLCPACAAKLSTSVQMKIEVKEHLFSLIIFPDGRIYVAATGSAGVAPVFGRSPSNHAAILQGRKRKLLGSPDSIKLAAF